MANLWLPQQVSGSYGVVNGENLLDTTGSSESASVTNLMDRVGSSSMDSVAGGHVSSRGIDNLVRTGVPDSDHTLCSSSRRADQETGAWATRKDWAQHRSVIEQLYSRMPLKGIVGCMKAQHGFKATESMYKKQFKRWNLAKTNREGDMIAIVHENDIRTRKGKRTMFRLRGQCVDYQDVVRYWHRKGMSIDDVIAQREEFTAPETLEIITPVPSPVTTPEILAIPQLILRSVGDYIAGSFESGVWISSGEEDHCFSAKTRSQAHIEFYELFLVADDLILDDMFQEAGSALVSASAKIHQILTEEDPHTLIHLCSLILISHGHNRGDIILVMLKQFDALGEVIVGPRHPLRRICARLSPIGSSQVCDVVINCLRRSADSLDGILGPLHISAIVSRCEYTDALEMSGNASDAWALLLALLSECEASLGSFDHRALRVNLYIAHHLLETGRNCEGVQSGQSMVRHASALPDKTTRDNYVAWGLEVVARCHHGLGQLSEAVTTLREANDLLQSEQDACLFIKLEQWLKEDGQPHAAAEVREQWKVMFNPNDFV